MPIISIIGSTVIALLSIFTRRKPVFPLAALVFQVIDVALTYYIGYLVFYVDETIIYGAGGWIPPLGIVYIVDRASALLSIATSTILLLVMIYSIGYFKDKGIAYFYSLLLLLEAGLSGIFYTGDLFHLKNGKVCALSLANS